ncbi:ComEC/Rec2 family competence protein [Candidatus Kuenenbacteria bacterium]|nr:ComEC/Rec2 family competence protein [Candidatus Kuenenbacteria bacterium]
MRKSKIFLFICLAFILGIFISSWIKIPSIFLEGFFVFEIFWIIFLWPRDNEKILSWDKNKIFNIKMTIIGFCFLSLVFGIFYLQKSFSRQSALQPYNDAKEEIILKGIILNDLGSKKNSKKIIFEVYEIFTQRATSPWLANSNSQKINPIRSLLSNRVKEKILLYLPPKINYQYGDELEIKTKLKTPLESKDFSYKNYLDRYHIHSIAYYPKIKFLAQNKGNFIQKNLFLFKDKFKEKILTILSPPESSFLAGLLIGTREDIPSQLINSFNITGTIHLIALSGYNITIIGILLMNLFYILYFSKSASFWLTIIGIIFFVILTGAEASVVRAAIMGILVLLSKKIGRLKNITNAVVFTACLMLLFNPKILRYDIGFQLSFLATLGIIYLSPILFKKGFYKIPNILQFRESFLMTVSAQIMTLPIIVYNFGQLSLIAPITNVFILPIVPLSMLWGFIATIISFFWVWLAKIVGFFAWIFLAYEIKTIKLFSEIPFASIKIEIHWSIVFLIYGLIILWIWKNQESLKQ